MCTRYRSPISLMRLALKSGKLVIPNFELNYNLAPTEKSPIIRTSKSEGRKIVLAQFGNKPAWSKSIIVNAKSETVRTLKTFKDAYQTRRCIIPADGFYEWRTENGKKQPYYFFRKDGELILFAGIWDYAEVGGERIFSFTMLTGKPNSLMAQYHDRMPIITDDIDTWLNLECDPLELIQELPLAAYGVRPMNSAMNNPRVKDPAAIDPEYVALR